jgi:diguanylate cyclase (GGDEF)-like protein
VSAAGARVHEPDDGAARPAPGAGVVALLAHLRTVLPADVVEAFVLAADDGPGSCTSVGPEGSEHAPVDPEAPEPPCIRRIGAQGEAGGAGTSVIAAPLHGEAPGLGVLVARRRGGAPFAAGDVRLLDAAGHLVGAAVEKAHLERSLAHLRGIEAQLTHRAFHDPLTGLPNRVLFADRVAHALARRTRERGPVAVLFVDLDDFKAVNDTLGHAAGDALLRHAATRLQACTRPGDTAARLGGDEFALLLEDLDDPDEATAVAERLVAGFAAPVALAEGMASVRASVGVAVSTSLEEAPDELLANADLAMYAAKAAGKGQHRTFEPPLRALVAARRDLSAGLRRALEHAEMELHYQPIVRLGDGAVVGLEALLRWRHPERGLLLPAHFLDVAEESGLIVPVGRWMLAEACRQARRWQALRPGLPAPDVWVNLSARQVHRPGLLEEIVDALATAGLGADRLVLEITEGVVMRDAARSARTMRDLKDLGARVAIDDFGSGYSSLGDLRSFPVDVLKVAGDFVAGVTDVDGTGPFVEALVQLGHTLGLVVVAEGLEGPEQVARLRAMGCDLGQGYHVGRPLRRRAVDRLLLGLDAVGTCRLPDGADATGSAEEAAG